MFKSGTLQLLKEVVKPEEEPGRDGSIFAALKIVHLLQVLHIFTRTLS